MLCGSGSVGADRAVCSAGLCGSGSVGADRAVCVPEGSLWALWVCVVWEGLLLLSSCGGLEEHAETDSPPPGSMSVGAPRHAARPAGVAPGPGLRGPLLWEGVRLLLGRLSEGRVVVGRSAVY